MDFDGSILHKKVMGTADKLGITDFVGLNGCIDHIWKKHATAYEGKRRSGKCEHAYS